MEAEAEVVAILAVLEDLGDHMAAVEAQVVTIPTPQIRAELAERELRD